MRDRGGFDSNLAKLIIERHFRQGSEDVVTSQVGLLTKDGIAVLSQDDENSGIKFPNYGSSSVELNVLDQGKKLPV